MILPKIKGINKRFLAFFLSVILLVSLSSCNPLKSAKSVNANEQIVQAILSDPKTFNPLLSKESPNVFGLIYEGLTSEDIITGEIEPRLAESWEISDDGLQITFTLRDNLKWSDGEPLTAEDVVFTYNQLYLNDDIPTSSRDILKVGKSQELPTVKKLNNLQVQFTIVEPFAPFLGNTGLSILPAHILREKVEKKDREGNLLILSTWDIGTPPEEIIVNGPYKLESYVTSQRIIFTKNPYYWQHDELGNQLPYVDQIVWEIVESTDTSLLQFRSGSLDSIGVSPEYFSLLKKEEERGNFTVYNGGPAYGMTFMSFNLNKGKRNGKPVVDPIKSKWFNNVKFRQAIAYAIDRQRMVNNIYRGLGEVQNTQISVQSPYYDSTIKGYEYNPELAKKILQEEGFKYNQAGVLLDEENNQVRFALLTNSGNKIRESLGAQIQQDLKEIGITVDFTPVAFNLLVNKLNESLDWEAHIIGFTGGNEPHGASTLWNPEASLHLFNKKPQAGSDEIEGRVIADWEQKISDLYIEASRELDTEKRKEIYAETQRLASEYLPLIYLVNPYSLGAVRNRFEGIEYSALGGAFWNIEKLQIVE